MKSTKHSQSHVESFILIPPGTTWPGSGFWLADVDRVTAETFGDRIGNFHIQSAVETRIEAGAQHTEHHERFVDVNRRWSRFDRLGHVQNEEQRTGQSADEKYRHQTQNGSGNPLFVFDRLTLETLNHVTDAQVAPDAEVKGSDEK